MNNIHCCYKVTIFNVIPKTLLE